MSRQPFLKRVVIKNYRSIATCDVKLRSMTFLVGPNGAGKSNFLDALRFVADSLRTTLDHALRDRGGIGEVRRRSAGHSNHFGLRLDFALEDGRWGHYSFRIAARKPGGHEVQEEECFVRGPALLSIEDYFRVEAGRVDSSVGSVPAAAPDRLYLVSASGLKEFRGVYDALSQMGFYNLSPDRIRDLQPPDAGDVLARDGSNITSVISRIERESESHKRRIEEYLSKVVPGVEGVSVKMLGPRETLEFRQKTAGSKDSWRFQAANMSDGTLRTLGILVAVFQSTNGQRVPLVGIEEPEAALHPGAAGILISALQEAARSIQIVITSHSPDLLDDESIEIDSILAVEAEGGTTHIAPIHGPAVSALRDRLYTPGELLRMNQLRPDPKPAPRQAHLFETGRA